MVPSYQIFQSRVLTFGDRKIDRQLILILFCPEFCFKDDYHQCLREMCQTWSITNKLRLYSSPHVKWAQWINLRMAWNMCVCYWYPWKWSPNFKLRPRGHIPKALCHCEILISPRCLRLGTLELKILVWWQESIITDTSTKDRNLWIFSLLFPMSHFLLKLLLLMHTHLKYFLRFKIIMYKYYMLFVLK
jgi:hypothetical protein